MQKLNQEIAQIKKSVEEWQAAWSKSEDLNVLFEMAKEEKDEAVFSEACQDLQTLSEIVEKLELQKLLSGPTDANNAFMSINSGAGGTEACDWAEILFRMYTRYIEEQGFGYEILEMTGGEEAGIKSVSFSVTGTYAFGYLKSESGVHRLVRISPFDSNARRHTSFASVFVTPEIDDEIAVEIDDSDLRIDTYRASGAGGQHVNRTDSAVRITHVPSGVVVQCQKERSQHGNKDRAMKMLRAALYDIELKKRQAEIDEQNSQKKINEWGSQIRSYVLHPYKMVKDHRTNAESSQAEKVLDGDLQTFIDAFLKFIGNQ